MNIFGKEHIWYLVISIMLTIVGLVLCKKFCRSDKSKRVCVVLTAGVYLAMLVLNRIFCVLDLNDSSFWPYSVCSVMGFALTICVLVTKPYSKVLMGLTLMTLLAGVISTVYPNYLPTNAVQSGNYSIFFSCTITSLIHHSLAIYLPLLMLLLGHVKIDIKNWASGPLAYCVLITYGVFVIKIVGKSDAMLINYPILAGTILNWFYIGLIFFALYTIFLLLYDTIKYRQNCWLVTKWRTLFGSQSKKVNNTKDNTTPHGGGV